MRGGKRPGAGRPKGSPNKVTTVAKEAFLLAFQHLEGDLESYIRRTGEGETVKVLQKDGSLVEAKVGADPARAADLLIRMAEYHFPKQAKHIVAGDGDSPVIIEVRTMGERS